MSFGEIMTEEIPTGTNGIKSVKISRRAIWFLATFFILSFSCLCSSVFSISRMVTKMISGDGIENIDINIYAPITVQKGEVFDIELTVTNRSDEAQSIDSVGFAAGYLDGIELISTQPRFYDREKLEILGMDFDTFIFLEVVRPGETIVIKIESQALLTGDFGGQVGVCITEVGSCEMLVVRTIVEE
jgi:hypothetical protein